MPEWERIKKGSNGKNHEAVVIKYYLGQRKKTLENSDRNLNETLKNCIRCQPVQTNILKIIFHADVPKLSTFLNSCHFISPFFKRKWLGANSTRKPSSRHIKSN